MVEQTNRPAGEERGPAQAIHCVEEVEEVAEVLALRRLALQGLVGLVSRLRPLMNLASPRVALGEEGGCL